MKNNQSHEIYDYIKENPGAIIDDISRETGWHRYVVETAIRIMSGNGMIVKNGKTDWGDDKFKAV